MSKEQLFAIIDTETTGGNPSKDRIMEIAILLHDGRKIIKEFSTLVNPETPVMPFVRSLTGIKDEMLVDAPRFSDLAKEIFEITENTILVAHNARFDYGVLRNEFRRIGIRFERKQLCTVKLAHQFFPDIKSYSLGNLCRDLKIEIDNRHRAFGDALATSVLFEKMYSNDQNLFQKAYFNEDANHLIELPHLPYVIIDDLPQETGIFYILNQEGKPIYIAKSVNIRKKVLSLFNSKQPNKDLLKFQHEIYDINYELTGSHLIAMILESRELQNHLPFLNKTKRKGEYKFGIFYFKDEYGYFNLKLEEISPLLKPLIEFTNRKSANTVLNRIIQKYQLLPELCGRGIPDYSNSIMPNPQIYNQKFNSLLKSYHYKNPNFFIISEGKSQHQQSLVWIENHQYKGFGYFEPEFIDNDIHSLKEVIQIQDDNPDVHRIIRNWLSKKKYKSEIIAY